MKTAIVIIDGVKFPHLLAGRAVAWAKKEGAQLHALFLTSGEEMPEEYAFPSDIDQAETLADTGDTEKESAKILRSQVKFFKDLLKTENIPGQAELMNDASLEQVLTKVKSADLLFVAPGYGEVSLQAVTRFSMEEVIDKASIPVEVVTKEGA